MGTHGANAARLMSRAARTNVVGARSKSARSLDRRRSACRSSCVSCLAAAGAAALFRRGAAAALPCLDGPRTAAGLGHHISTPSAAIDFKRAHAHAPRTPTHAGTHSTFAQTRRKPTTPAHAACLPNSPHPLNLYHRPNLTGTSPCGSEVGARGRAVSKGTLSAHDGYPEYSHWARFAASGRQGPGDRRLRVR